MPAELNISIAAAQRYLEDWNAVRAKYGRPPLAPRMHVTRYDVRKRINTLKPPRAPRHATRPQRTAPSTAPRRRRAIRVS
jgi:hypothetical protein